MPDEAALLTLIVQCARTAVLSRYRRSSCIVTTRVIVAVASRYGIAVVPQPVSVCAFNAQAAELFDAGVPLDDWPEEAHSVGVTGIGPSKPGKWNGHLIGLTSALLIDGSLDQMSRPRRGLRLAPLIAQLPLGGWAKGSSARLTHESVLLIYSRIGDDGYLTSPNWNRRDPHVREVVQLALRGVRRADKAH